MIWDLVENAACMELVLTNAVGGGLFLPGRAEFIAGEAFGAEQDRAVVLWDLTNQRPKARVSLGTRGVWSDAGYDTALTKNGDFVVVADVDGKVKVFDAHSLALVGSFVGADGVGLTAIALSPDDQILATATYGDPAIKLWDLESALRAACSGVSLQPVASLEGHQGWIMCTCLKFSPDGRLLASGSTDHSSGIWNLRSRKLERFLHGHESHVLSVQFAPNGQLYTSGRDERVCVWDLDAPGRQLGPKRRPLGIPALALSPAGRRLAVVQTNGMVLLIGTTPEPVLGARKHTALVALVVLTLALAAVGSVKNPVTRPFKGTGVVTVTFRADVANGIVTAESIDVGQATHTGRYTNRATATGSLADVLQGLLPSPNSGVTTAANGDQVSWGAIPGSAWACSITGGTGRFQGCFGGMNYVYQSPMVVSYPDAFTIVATWTEQYEGTITY